MKERDLVKAAEWNRISYRRHREERIAKTLAYRKLHPNKFNARQAVKYAVKTGRLKRLSCEVCGNPLTHAHHHKGYSLRHRLHVIWLCVQHHSDVHNNKGRL